MTRCASRRREPCSARCAPWPTGWPRILRTRHPSAGARRHAGGAGRADRRGARARARRRQGGGRARAGAAPGAARGRRGGRRRVWPDGDRRGHGRRPAGRRRLPTCRTSSPPAGRVTCPSTSPRSFASAPTSRSRGGGSRASRSSRRSRGSGTACWWWATSAPSACTCTPTSPRRARPLRGRRRGLPARRGRHARADGGPHAPGSAGATAPASSRAAARSSQLPAAPGWCGSIAELGALVVDGGRDDEPLDVRHPRRHPRGRRATRRSCFPTART